MTDIGAASARCGKKAVRAARAAAVRERSGRKKTKRLKTGSGTGTADKLSAHDKKTKSPRPKPGAEARRDNAEKSEACAPEGKSPFRRCGSASPARRSLRYGRRLDKQDISVFLGKSYYYAVGAV